MTSRRRKLTLWVSPLALLAVVVVWGGHQVDRVQARANLLAATGTAALRLLGEIGAGLEEGDLDRLLACYDDEYLNPAQGSWLLDPVSERDGVAVFRWREGDPRTFDKTAVGEGWAELLAGVEGLETAKLKLARVERISDPGGAVVRSVLWLRGRLAGGERFETQARFRFFLSPREGGGCGGWAVARQELLGGTTTRGRGEGFAEVAAAAGIDHRARHNPLFDTPEWRPEAFGIIRYGSAGVSAADVDGDGWVDLYFADGAAPRLYRNLGAAVGGGLRFADVTAAAGLPVEVAGVNVALFVDLDNDGDDDLFLGRFMERNLLFRNDGAGADGVPRFTDLSDAVDLGASFVVVASAADYDRDGDLDLYLAATSIRAPTCRPPSSTPATGVETACCATTVPARAGCCASPTSPPRRGCARGASPSASPGPTTTPTATPTSTSPTTSAATPCCATKGPTLRVWCASPTSAPRPAPSTSASG